MKAKLAIFSSILFILFILSPGNSQAAGEWNVFPQQSITDVQKIWKVTFNKDVDIKTVNEENLYILDQQQQKIDISWTSEGEQLRIKAKEPYTNGQKYTLYIGSSIMSKQGKQLGKAVSFTFTVEAPLEKPEGYATGYEVSNTSLHSESVGILSSADAVVYYDDGVYKEAKVDFRGKLEIPPGGSAIISFPDQPAGPLQSAGGLVVKSTSEPALLKKDVNVGDTVQISLKQASPMHVFLQSKFTKYDYTHYNGQTLLRTEIGVGNSTLPMDTNDRLLITNTGSSTLPVAVPWRLGVIQATETEANGSLILKPGESAIVKNLSNGSIHVETEVPEVNIAKYYYSRYSDNVSHLDFGVEYTSNGTHLLGANSEMVITLKGKYSLEIKAPGELATIQRTEIPAVTGVYMNDGDTIQLKSGVNTGGRVQFDKGDNYELNSVMDYTHYREAGYVESYGYQKVVHGLRAQPGDLLYATHYGDDNVFAYAPYRFATVHKVTDVQPVQAVTLSPNQKVRVTMDVSKHKLFKIQTHGSSTLSYVSKYTERGKTYERNETDDSNQDDKRVHIGGFGKDIESAETTITNTGNGPLVVAVPGMYFSLD